MAGYGGHKIAKKELRQPFLYALVKCWWNATGDATVIRGTFKKYPCFESDNATEFKESHTGTVATYVQESRKDHCLLGCDAL